MRTPQTKKTDTVSSPQSKKVIDKKKEDTLDLKKKNLKAKMQKNSPSDEEESNVKTASSTAKKADIIKKLKVPPKKANKDKVSS